MVEQPDYVKSVQEHSHAHTHEYGGADQISLTGLTGSLVFVCRGDVGAVDFDQDDLTHDNEWHDLDLSLIVPPGSKIARLSLGIADDVVNSSINIRRKGLTTAPNRYCLRTLLADQYHDGWYDAPLNDNRLIQYRVNVADVDVIEILVMGWFI